MARRLNPRLTLEAVANYFFISVEELKGPGRKIHITDARRMAMWVLHKEGGWGSPSVGYFLDKDHSSVISACQKMAEMMENDPSLRHDIDEIVTGVTDAMAQEKAA